jgi:hypothetical protein
MAVIANNVIALQRASVNYTLDNSTKFGDNLQVSNFVDVTKDKINSEAAAVRPLIKNFVAPAPVEPTLEVEVEKETVSEPITKRKEVHQEVLVKRRVVGRSRYLSDMLTVE